VDGRSGRSALWMAAAMLLTASIVAGIASLPPALFLCVIEADTGRRLMEVRVKPGYKFATWMVHSVQLTPVVERFRVGENGRITATCVEFADLGWGLPSTVNGTVEISETCMRIDGYSIEMDELPFRVSHVNNAKLVLVDDRKEIPLVDLVADGRGIRIRVEKIPFYVSILGGSAHANPVSFTEDRQHVRK